MTPHHRPSPLPSPFDGPSPDPGDRVTAIACALLAVMAAREGDAATAMAHISLAQQCARTSARRERQLVEIAAVVVAGDRERAAGLALEHLAQFPGDADLLARVEVVRTRAADENWQATNS